MPSSGIFRPSFVVNFKKLQNNAVDRDPNCAFIQLNTFTMTGTVELEKFKPYIRKAIYIQS